MGGTDFQASGERHNAFQWMQSDAHGDGATDALRLTLDARCVHSLTEDVDWDIW